MCIDSTCPFGREFTVDNGQGMYVCNKCGIVQPGIVMDEQEWRDYETDDPHTVSSSRVGGSTLWGIPYEIQLSTYNTFEGHTRCTEPRLSKYIHTHKILDQMASRLGLSSCQHTSYELYGLMRTCTSVIQDTTACYAAILYHAAQVCGKTIPVVQIVNRITDLNRVQFRRYLNRLERLILGEVDNSQAVDVAFSRNGYVVGPERTMYVHLLAESQEEASARMVREFLIRMDLQSLYPATQRLLKVYMDSTIVDRSQDLVAAGIIRHVMRYLSTLDNWAPVIQKRFSVAKLLNWFGVSESAVNGMCASSLPPLHATMM